jgi:hypothetical protein
VLGVVEPDDARVTDGVAGDEAAGGLAPLVVTVRAAEAVRGAGTPAARNVS